MFTYKGNGHLWVLDQNPHDYTYGGRELAEGLVLVEGELPETEECRKLPLD